jgi:hypothetical protein
VKQYVQFVVCALVMLLALYPFGCSIASPEVRVSPSAAAPAGGVGRPSVIYVTDFYLDPASIQEAQKPAQMLGKRSGPLSGIRSDIKSLRRDDPAGKAQDLMNLLAETITKELAKAGYRAERLPNRSGLRAEYFPQGVTLPTTGWLLFGRFEQVVENKPAVEATVGFGKGAGEVTIEVEVSDLAGDPRSAFLTIGSQSGAHKRPGGLVTMNPYAMAAKFVLSRGETEKDVKREGAAIAQSLISFIEHGPEKKVPSEP